VGKGLEYLAESVLDFLERKGETFLLEGESKTVYVGRNMPGNLVSLIKNGSFLLDQEIESKLAPYLVNENTRISWQICSYLSTSFLLLHYTDKNLIYVDLIHSELVEDLIYFAKAEGKYVDLSIAQ
jgi:hypothetical protein